ncbi:MAG: hypothetical protein MRY32_10000 [Rickettsiales bacterium]|nr:hypothetical protein [Rickettsiales bacterium]
MGREPIADTGVRRAFWNLMHDRDGMVLQLACEAHGGNSNVAERRRVANHIGHLINRYAGNPDEAEPSLQGITLQADYTYGDDPFRYIELRGTAAAALLRFALERAPQYSTQLRAMLGEARATRLQTDYPHEEALGVSDDELIRELNDRLNEPEYLEENIHHAVANDAFRAELDRIVRAEPEAIFRMRGGLEFENQMRALDIVNGDREILEAALLEFAQAQQEEHDCTPIEGWDRIMEDLGMNRGFDALDAPRALDERLDDPERLAENIHHAVANNAFRAELDRMVRENVETVIGMPGGFAFENRIRPLDIVTGDRAELEAALLELTKARQEALDCSPVEAWDGIMQDLGMSHSVDVAVQTRTDEQQPTHDVTDGEGQGRLEDQLERGPENYL